MASRTQMRLAQITGSFGLLPGQISDQRPEQAVAGAPNAAALLMSSGSLLGPMSEMASAIKRIHGGDQFAAAAPGQFFVDIMPAANNQRNLGSPSLKFANVHSTKLFLAGDEINALDADLAAVSAAHDSVASALAVKTYVDAQVTAQDLDFKGDTGGDLEIDLDSERLIIAGGVALSTVGNTNTVTVNLDNTTVTAASYGAATKSLTATVDAQGRLTAMSHADIAIPHTQITDFDTGVRTNKVHELAVPTASFPMNSQKITGLLDPTDAQDAATKAYVDAEITDNNLGFQGDEGAGSLEIDLDAEKLSILGTANEIVTAGSGNAVTISLPDDVTIGRDLVVTRNLTVNGDQFKIDGETVVMNDTLMEMGTQGATNLPPASATTKDLGLLMHRWDATESAAHLQFMGWDESEGKFIMRSGVEETSGILTDLGAAAALEVGAFDAGVSALASVTVSGASVLNGTVALGSDANDLITPNGVFAGDLVPTGVNRKLGSPNVGSKWAELHVAGEAIIDDIKLDGKTIEVLDTGSNADLTLAPKGTGSVVMSRVDINGGAIDATDVTVGTGKTLDVSDGTLTLADNQISGDKVEGGTIAGITISSLVATTADINGGTIDGAIIGASAAAAGTFTALACDAKALDAAALDIAARADITLHIDDVFAISDTSASNTIMKVSLGNIQTFLAVNGSEKHVEIISGGGFSAGTLLDVGALAGITANLWHAAAEKQQEVYCNGQLLARGANSAAGMDWYKATGAGNDGKISFAFDLEDDDVLQFVLRG